jgi:hypothetical protein
MTQYAIRYYRDQVWANRYLHAGVPNKPAGWVLSPQRYENRHDCIADIQHINSRGPKYPAQLVILWNGIERT